MEVKHKPQRQGSYCEVVLPEDAKEAAPAEGKPTVWKRGADAEAIMMLLAAEANKASSSRTTVELGDVSVQEIQELTRPKVQRSPHNRRAAPRREGSAGTRVIPKTRTVTGGLHLADLPQAEWADAVSLDPQPTPRSRMIRSHTVASMHTACDASPPAMPFIDTIVPPTESDLSLTYSDDYYLAESTDYSESRDTSYEGDSAPSSQRSSMVFDETPHLPEVCDALSGLEEHLPALREPIPALDAPLPALEGLPTLEKSLPESTEPLAIVVEPPSVATGSLPSAVASLPSAASPRRGSSDIPTSSSAELLTAPVGLRSKPKKKGRHRQHLAPEGSSGKRAIKDKDKASSHEELIKSAKKVQQDMKLAKSRSSTKTIFGMLRSSTSENLAAAAMADSSQDTPEPSSKELSMTYGVLGEAIATVNRLHAAEASINRRIAALERREKNLLNSCDTLAVSTSPNPHRRKKKTRDLTVDVNAIVIGARLGSGASGAVVHSCIVDGWVCAMKQMNTKSKADLEAFEREMSILYRLPAHPNIVKYLFHKTIRGKLCLFMTKHETTLQMEVDRRKKCQPAELFSRSMLLHIARQVISGIAYLHKHQIIHRDIKCDNIFCTHGASGELEHAVVADFDTAKKTGVTNVPQSTIGTVGFMAPEVFAVDNESGYSYGVDVFSFGMLLYSMMTLEEPYFDITNRFHVYRAILANQPPLLGTAEIDRFGEGLVQLHRRCVQLDPNHRPSTAQVIEALDMLSAQAP